jgi:very-short-patch-repair endonuclease
LRRDSTFPERLLWSRLRDRRLREFKFRRQHPIGPFIVDLCCMKVPLVVELDGESHAESAKADRARTRYLERVGFQVVRFTNDELREDLDSVLDQLLSRLRERTASR